VNKDTKWGRWCINPLENRTVDSLSIMQVVDLLPEIVPIHYMKLDMQGLDGDVIKALPRAFLDRVQNLEFESVAEQCNTLYEVQTKCAELESYLHSCGFEGKCNIKKPRKQFSGLRKGKMDDTHGCELTSVFSRKTTHD
jgi:hypothetical protein